MTIMTSSFFHPKNLQEQEVFGVYQANLHQSHPIRWMLPLHIWGLPTSQSTKMALDLIALICSFDILVICPMSRGQTFVFLFLVPWEFCWLWFGCRYGCLFQLTLGRRDVHIIKKYTEYILFLPLPVNCLAFACFQIAIANINQEIGLWIIQVWPRCEDVLQPLQSSRSHRTPQSSIIWCKGSTGASSMAKGLVGFATCRSRWIFFGNWKCSKKGECFAYCRSNSRGTTKCPSGK